MARPKPKVIAEYTDKQFRSEQVLEAHAIYAVFYQSRPFNLKSFSSLVDYASVKYKKTSFSNPGHAFNLAERLNKKFKTDDFEVVRLTNGQVIQEETDLRDNAIPEKTSRGPRP
jgi:hypothetical protein